MTVQTANSCCDDWNRTGTALSSQGFFLPLRLSPPHLVAFAQSDTRKHRWAAERRHQNQRLHCSLPLRRHLLGLGELRNIGPGVLEGD
jgi:hypothetical protein